MIQIFGFLSLILAFWINSLNLITPPREHHTNERTAMGCGTPGIIETGSSTKLDPNSDGYFSIYSGSGFTLSSNEYTEFEDLAGIGGANLDWTRLGGSDPASDLSAGGGCGNTDIVNDADGGSDYAYYSIVDPDGTADNGDEYLAFALRISDKINGAFGFAFLMDSDNNCISGDGNAVCGNPCFEYEIQLSTSNSGGDVILYNVDGCYGTSDCGTLHGAGAIVCNPCNSDGLQVCAGSSACGTGDPVFWVYYIDFSDIPGVSSTSSFSITPASNTSGNAVIYKSANVSDYGGIDDLNDINGVCDCSTSCSGNPCSKCEQDCALTCASSSNAVNTPLPIQFMDISAIQTEKYIKIKWLVEESYLHAGYKVERSNDGSAFSQIGTITQLREHGEETYTFIDTSPDEGKNVYRIIQTDLDGKVAISNLLEMHHAQLEEHLWYSIQDKTLYFYRIDRFSIFNSNGQFVSTSSAKKQDYSHRLDVSNLSPGLYFIKGFDWTNEPFIKKILIQY